MKITQNGFYWFLWSLSSSASIGVLGFMMVYEQNSTLFLPGMTTNGHYQIEIKCSACHTPFMGVKPDACMSCHEEELKRANDSHPKSKFTDPRNADRVALLDARNCITCHEEHVEDRTHSMGVTLPTNYCYYCHQDIGQVRPSHRDLPYNSCATSGCHNFHDNTALYEDFLLDHANSPDLKSPAAIPALKTDLTSASHPAALTRADANAPSGMKFDSIVYQEWETTAHAYAGVNCMDCHSAEASGGSKTWTEIPSNEACARCHSFEHQSFLEGRHGMRLAQGLPPMRPAIARLPMKPESAQKVLNCNACHSAHAYDTRRAAVDACLQCHNDDHSLNYLNQDSPHYNLWKTALTSDGDLTQGVSCATCHMPRTEYKENGQNQIRIIHNQNDNLRPNEKMVRGVCLYCHGLQFTLDSLADEKLIQANFNHPPESHVQSIEWGKKQNDEITATKERKRN